MNLKLVALALSQWGVFTAEQAVACGLSWHALQRLLDKGVVRKIRLGAYTTQEYWDGIGEADRHRAEGMAALLTRRWIPGAQDEPMLAVGRASAGFLHGLPLPRDPRELPGQRKNTDELYWWERRPPHVDLISADRRKRTFRAGVEVRPASLPAAHVILDGALPISSLARTAVDLMREGTKGEAVMVADATLRKGVTRAELAAVADHARQWPNAVQAREAIAFANAAAESPAESLARWLCADDGLHMEVQVNLFDSAGWIARVDLLLRAFRLVLEVDGLVKYTDPWVGTPQEVMQRQQAREDRLIAAGWSVVRTGWYELMFEPQVLLARIRAAMASAPVSA